jgi:hypothetical protein
VINVRKNHWGKAGASVAAAGAGFLLFVATAGGAVPSPSPVPFDLAIQEMSVKQVSSTPMFRTVEIYCVVENRGPRTSSTTAWLVISRAGDAGPQVSKVVVIPKKMERGEKFETRVQAFSWVTASVPYRCEIQFGETSAAGDADPSNDFAGFTFPRF